MTLHQPAPGKFRFVVDGLDRPSGRDTWFDGPDLRLLALKLWMRRREIGRLTLVGLAAGAVLAVAAVLVRAPSYRASSELIVSYTSLQLSGQDAAVTQMLVDGSIVQSQIELVRSNGTLSRTVERLGAEAVLRLAARSSPLADLRASLALPALRGTPPDVGQAGQEERNRRAVATLRGLLTVRRLGASQIISLSAAAGAPQAAAELANAVAQDFLDEQRDMNALVTTSGVMRDRIRSIGPTVRIVSRAMPPDRPSGPGGMLVLVIGSLVGVAAAAAAGAARTLLDGRIILQEQLAAATGVECFGNFPRLGDSAARTSAQNRQVRAATSPCRQPSMLVNVLRLARSSLTQRASPGPRYLGVTSFAPGEGKSTVALAFAHLVAGEGQRVLLVDASSPNRELTRWLAPEATAGIGDALRNVDRFASVVVREIRPNLDFLPGVGQGSDLDDRWRRFSRGWRPAAGGEYDWCIFDLPSLNPSVDVRVAGEAMDKLILVTEWGRTPAAALEESLAALGPVRSRLAGAIINMTPPSALRAREQINSELRLPEPPGAKV